ncbi:hypothetical protein BGZ72_003783, partial [Mortierella alpina]
MLLYSYDSASSTSGVYVYNPDSVINVFAPLPNISEPFIFLQTENTTRGLVLSGNNTSSFFPAAPVIVKEALGTEQAEAIPVPDPGNNREPDFPSGAKVGLGVGGATLVIVFFSI